VTGLLRSQLEGPQVQHWVGEGQRRRETREDLEDAVCQAGSPGTPAEQHGRP
jgi:hypothetical protein